MGEIWVCLLAVDQMMSHGENNWLKGCGFDRIEGIKLMRRKSTTYLFTSSLRLKVEAFQICRILGLILRFLLQNAENQNQLKPINLLF